MRKCFTLMHEFYQKSKEKAKTETLQLVDNTSIRSLGLVAGGSIAMLLTQIPASAEGATVTTGVSNWVSIMGTFWTMITGNDLLFTLACGSVVFLAFKMWRVARH